MTEKLTGATNNGPEKRKFVKLLNQYAYVDMPSATYNPRIVLFGPLRIRKWEGLERPEGGRLEGGSLLRSSRWEGPRMTEGGRERKRAVIIF